MTLCNNSWTTAVLGAANLLACTRHSAVRLFSISWVAWWSMVVRMAESRLAGAGSSPSRDTARYL